MKKKTFQILSLVLGCIITGCVFPILNFNPNNPVDLGLGIRLIILFTAFLGCHLLGEVEQKLFSSWNIGQLALRNLAVGCVGLLLRFLLEFGEVSNTYNFTLWNVVFHLLFVAGFATLSTKGQPS